MSQIRLLLLFFLLSGFGFSQEERSGHLSLQIRNEFGAVFKGNILLLANEDTVSITASWNNYFRTDLLPGFYTLVLKNKLFNDYFIPSVLIKSNETKELEIVWQHRTIKLPEIRYPLCGIW